jgi:hypothetical protein
MTEHHELWKSLILLRTIKRTNKQMDRLLKRLAGCKCQMANAHIRMLHEVGEKRRRELVGRSDPNIDLAAQGKHSATFPSKATASGSCSSYIRLLLVQRRTAGGPSQNDCKRLNAWPTSPADLIPKGADVFVESMLRWRDILQDTIVFLFCSSVLRICRAILLPSLVSHAFADHLVRAGRGRRLFDRTITHRRTV